MPGSVCSSPSNTNSINQSPLKTIQSLQTSLLYPHPITISKPQNSNPPHPQKCPTSSSGAAAARKTRFASTTTRTMKILARPVDTSAVVCARSIGLAIWGMGISGLFELEWGVVMGGMGKGERGREGDVGTDAGNDDDREGGWMYGGCLLIWGFVGILGIGMLVG